MIGHAEARFAAASSRRATPTSRLRFSLSIVFSIVLILGSAWFGHTGTDDNGAAYAGAGVVSKADNAAPLDSPTALLDAINSLRTSAKPAASPLSADAFVETGAQLWADELVVRVAASHDPNLRASVDDGWDTLAEYVAVGADTPQALAEILRTPGAKTMLTDPRTTSVGVGLAERDGKVAVVVRAVRMPA